MLHERVASHPSPVPRPRKRRRTATQVLAGYFDSPNLSRDFFTDMANSDETIRAVNSIIARNSTLFIDPRFPHIGPLKTHPHRHHRSLTIRLPNVTDPSQRTLQDSPQTSLDRRTKLMGRIQDISHLLLSHYDSEFIKESTDPSLNLPPPCPNTQPDDLRNLPLSPQNSALASTPSQAVNSPRHLVLPEFVSEPQRRSPDNAIMEQDFGCPPSRAAVTIIGDSRSPHRRASFTASPPTPTRSITSLTSHASSKWPHTPDNEAGPSFAELPESYADYAPYPHEPINTDLTIIQPHSPPTSSWQPTPSASSPKSTSAVEPPQWMMTHVREGKVVESVQRRSRGFSLDNILSPAPSACNSPHSADVRNVDELTPMEISDDDTPKVNAENDDVRIPFVATPEREMSVASDHPLQPRSRRRSRAMKIVESDEETEGEKEKRVKKAGEGLEKKHPPSRLTIKIRPLAFSTASKSSASTSVAKTFSGSAATTAEINRQNSSSASAPTSPPATADVPQGTTGREPSTDVLPPLIPGKARKRKAPPARKGWKGWVEVEVDESHRPVKGLNLDDLPLGERRTRSGKQFDG